MTNRISMNMYYWVDRSMSDIFSHLIKTKAKASTCKSRRITVICSASHWYPNPSHIKFNYLLSVQLVVLLSSSWYRKWFTVHSPQPLVLARAPCLSAPVSLIYIKMQLLLFHYKPLCLNSVYHLLFKHISAFILISTIKL